MVTKRNTTNNGNINRALLKPIQEALSGKMFSGWLGERKWIEKLNNYRDVIEVDEWEDEINVHLNCLVIGVDGVDSGKCWINITGPSASTPCYSLWILLAELVPIGHYWFKIEDILFDDIFGLNIVIKPIRIINQFDGETFEERCQRQRMIDKIDPAEIWKEIIANMKIDNFQTVRNFFFTSFSPSNIAMVFRLAVIFFMTAFTLCKEMCSFLLQFIHELGILIQRSTPLFESLINFIGKIIGGVLIFFTMIYNDIRHPRPKPTMPAISSNPTNAGHKNVESMHYIPPNRWQSQQNMM